MVAPGAYVLADGRRVYPAFLLNSESGGGIVTPPASFTLPDGRAVMGVVLVDETGAIMPTVGAGDPALIQSVDPATGSNAAVAASTNYLARAPRLHVDTTISTLVCHLGAAAGNLTMAVYTSDNGGANLTRVGTTGAVAAVTGINANAVTTPFTWEAGRDYWFDWYTSDAASTPWRPATGSAVVNGRGNRSISAVETTAAPSSLTKNVNQGAIIWMRAE